MGRLKTKHTPGPWRARDCELIGGDGTLVATLHWHSGRDPENQADAALIAAAPDLLDALVYAMPYLKAAVPRPRDDGQDINCVTRAELAIAKATARAPLEQEERS